jgi:carboxylesterase type B
MVFFHGGGFMCGSGTKAFYGPDTLLEHDVIFIGANYRVGPLGFLSTGDDNSPGNFGLKDQNLVLRWIQENIAAFGGDKARVTIFGESAGGASVTYHMQSPLSKGLFHRGIAQSGTDLAPWGAVAHRGVAVERARRMGEMLECPTHDNAELVACLRRASAEDITVNFYEYFKWDTDPMVPFPPVVEHEHDGAFITVNPRFVSDMHGNDVPLMTGVTTEEGVLKTGALIYDSDLTADLLKNWERALPVSLYYDHHDQRKQEAITRQVDEFYFNNQRLTLDTQKNLTDLWTDAWFFHAMVDYLKLRFSDERRAATYVYLFSHKGAASFSEVFKAGSEAYYGTAHAEELQYLFPIRKDLPYFFASIPTRQDRRISAILTKLWVNFAYSG